MILTLIITMLIVGLSVIIHYEFLIRIAIFMSARATQPRSALVIGILCTLLAHILEIWFFAVGYFGLIQTGQYGTLLGDFTGGLRDCMYYSFVTYTTLGFGGFCANRSDSLSHWNRSVVWSGVHYLDRFLPLHPDAKTLGQNYLKVFC